MELVFVKSLDTNIDFDKKHGKHLKANTYTIGKYEVIENIYTYDSGNSYTYVEVHTVGKDDYLPRIYAREDIFNDLGITGFEIQTTSYGSLPIDEIQKIVIAFNEAIEVAQVLTEKFVK